MFFLNLYYLVLIHFWNLLLNCYFWQITSVYVFWNTYKHKIHMLFSFRSSEFSFPMTQIAQHIVLAEQLGFELRWLWKNLIWPYHLITIGASSGKINSHWKAIFAIDTTRFWLLIITIKRPGRCKMSQIMFKIMFKIGSVLCKNSKLSVTSWIYFLLSYSLYALNTNNAAVYVELGCLMTGRMRYQN